MKPPLIRMCRDCSYFFHFAGRAFDPIRQLQHALQATLSHNGDGFSVNTPNPRGEPLWMLALYTSHADGDNTTGGSFEGLIRRYDEKGYKEEYITITAI